jgi:hypothetical protein
VYLIAFGSPSPPPSRSPGGTALRALLFVCSDSLLACRIFLPDFELAQQDLIIMALYLAGQGLIV